MLFKNTYKCSAIAEIIDGKICYGPDVKLSGINRIEDATKGELTFYSNKKYEKFLLTSEASCIIINEELDYSKFSDTTFILVSDAHLAFGKLLNVLNSMRPKLKPQIHKTAVIDDSATVSPDAYIGPYCVIGENSKIDANVVLHSNVVLYSNVIISEQTIINSGVVCYEDTKIGKNCIIHSGAVIGSDGFGYEENPDGTYLKIPQLGNVVIEDNVEIGANTTIDCATIGSTIIRSGVKIDNLCQIAHNVTVGENTAMASQVGISGSTKIGKRNKIGGQAGLAGHMDTADDVVLYAKSGVPKSITEKGIYFGSPARDRGKAFRIEAALNNLPQTLNDFFALKRKLEEAGIIVKEDKK